MLLTSVLIDIILPLSVSVLGMLISMLSLKKILFVKRNLKNVLLGNNKIIEKEINENIALQAAIELMENNPENVIIEAKNNPFIINNIKESIENDPSYSNIFHVNYEKIAAPIKDFESFYIKYADKLFNSDIGIKVLKNQISNNLQKKRRALVYIDLCSAKELVANKSDALKQDFFINFNKKIDNLAKENNGEKIRSLGDGAIIMYPSIEVATAATKTLQEELNSEGIMMNGVIADINNDYTEFIRNIDKIEKSLEPNEIITIAQTS